MNRVIKRALKLSRRNSEWYSASPRPIHKIEKEENNDTEKE